MESNNAFDSISGYKNAIVIMKGENGMDALTIGTIIIESSNETNIA